jgi:hypothetical protein
VLTVWQCRLDRPDSVAARLARELGGRSTRNRRQE